MSLPDDRFYSDQHEWVRTDDGALPRLGSRCLIGITRTASDQLGDVVFVDLPAVGATVGEGEICGEIESTKAVSDLYSPVTGTVVAVNAAGVAEPGVVNEDPYGAGWLLEVEATSAPTGLLTPAQYRDLVGA